MKLNDFEWKVNIGWIGTTLLKVKDKDEFMACPTNGNGTPDLRAVYDVADMINEGAHYCEDIQFVEAISPYVPVRISKEMMVRVHRHHAMGFDMLNLNGEKATPIPQVTHPNDPVEIIA